MKKCFASFFIFILVSSSIKAQLLVEDFSYQGQKLTDHGWVAHSSNGVNPIQSVAGLVYEGYAGSGGGAAYLCNTGEDVNKTFTSQTTGVIYYSFLISVESAGSTGGYFIHLYNTSANIYGRVSVKSVSGGIQFGLSNATSVSYGSGTFSTGGTYLCIVKYTVSSAGACSLWVFENGVPSTEGDAGVPLVSMSSSGLTSRISSVALRQTDASQKVKIGGLRVTNSWLEIPLPVELVSFNSKTTDKGVLLSWTTATEINNYGFEIQRKTNTTSWKKIGFVDGGGNSNATKNYSYNDTPGASGKYYYRLKQIDNDGKSEILSELSQEYYPKGYTLEQNYPNPFNPVTTINYSIPMSADVKIVIYNITGKKLITLVDAFKEAGSYTVDFDASKFSSGTYVYKLETKYFTMSKKMTLLK